MSLGSAPSARLRRLACARCGTPFDCGSTAGHCWCAQAEFRLPLPALDATEDCLCQACLRKAVADLSG